VFLANQDHLACWPFRAEQSGQAITSCVRSRKQPNCPFEIGWRSAIACQMAVASYRLGRTVRWDAEREEIV
jgi:hypothetical protein